MEIETINGVLEEKDRYCLFLGRYSPEGDIFVVCETKGFTVEYLGCMSLQFFFLFFLY